MKYQFDKTSYLAKICILLIVRFSFKILGCYRTQYLCAPFTISVPVLSLIIIHNKLTTIVKVTVVTEVKFWYESVFLKVKKRKQIFYTHNTYHSFYVIFRYNFFVEVTK